MKKLLSFLLIALIGILSITLASSTPDGWVIPEKYHKMKNPYYGDKTIVPQGKMLFAKYCKSCHGTNGLGDGVMSKRLKAFPGDFSTEQFQSRSDGVLYYQSFVGKGEMPNFEKKIMDEEYKWSIINFIRTL